MYYSFCIQEAIRKQIAIITVTPQSYFLRIQFTERSTVFLRPTAITKATLSTITATLSSLTSKKPQGVSTPTYSTEQAVNSLLLYENGAELTVYYLELQSASSNPVKTRNLISQIPAIQRNHGRLNDFVCVYDLNDESRPADPTPSSTTSIPCTPAEFYRL